MLPQTGRNCRILCSKREHLLDIHLLCVYVCVYMYIIVLYKLDDSFIRIDTGLVLAKSLLRFRHCSKETSLLPDKKI